MRRSWPGVNRSGPFQDGRQTPRRGRARRARCGLPSSARLWRWRFETSPAGPPWDRPGRLAPAPRRPPGPRKPRRGAPASSDRSTTASGSRATTSAGRRLLAHGICSPEDARSPALAASLQSFFPCWRSKGSNSGNPGGRMTTPRIAEHLQTVSFCPGCHAGRARDTVIDWIASYIGAHHVEADSIRVAEETKGLRGRTRFPAVPGGAGRRRPTPRAPGDSRRRARAERPPCSRWRRIPGRRRPPRVVGEDAGEHRERRRPRCWHWSAEHRRGASCTGAHPPADEQ